MSTSATEIADILERACEMPTARVMRSDTLVVGLGGRLLVLATPSSSEGEEGGPSVAVIGQATLTPGATSLHPNFLDPRTDFPVTFDSRIRIWRRYLWAESQEEGFPRSLVTTVRSLLTWCHLELIENLRDLSECDDLLNSEVVALRQLGFRLTTPPRMTPLHTYSYGGIGGLRFVRLDGNCAVVRTSTGFLSKLHVDDLEVESTRAAA